MQWNLASGRNSNGCGMKFAGSRLQDESIDLLIHIIHNPWQLQAKFVFVLFLLPSDLELSAVQNNVFPLN